MNTYRILQSREKSSIAIKHGFCWPAAFFAPIWAASKGFWPGAALLLTMGVFLNLLSSTARDTQHPALALGSFLAYLFYGFVVGKYSNFLLLAYKLSKGYTVTEVVAAESASDALASVTLSPQSAPASYQS